jgi:hypothetical protein
VERNRRYTTERRHGDILGGYGFAMGIGEIVVAVVAILGSAVEGWAYFGDHLWHDEPKRDPRNLRPPF